MLSNIKKWSLLSLFIVSSSAMASPTTANFSGIGGSGSINNFSMSVDGVSVHVSSWSDTEGSNDDLIDRAHHMDKYNGGWAMVNQDEAKGYNACSTYGHSADNIYDKNCGSKVKYRDYDFFMLEFSEAVNLTQATYSWVNGNASQNQVTIAALNPGGLATSSGKKVLTGQTWQGVKNNHTTASGYAQMQYNSSLKYFTNFGSGTTNTSSSYSTVWLIGALNTLFGGDINLEGNDGMKLKTVSFNKAPGVPHIPEPNVFILMLLSLAGLTYFRKSKA